MFQIKKIADKFCLIPSFVFLYLFVYLKDLVKYEVNSDEGINLIKGLLLKNGSEFTTEIWSDQPPMLSFLLKCTFNLFGTGIEQARILILIICFIGIIIFYKLIREYVGFYIANLTILLLFTNFLFAQYSTLILIGYPAIVFALGVIYLLELKTKKLGHTILAGVLFAISFTTKLFTLLYFIPILISIFTKKNLKKNLVAFILPCSITTLIISLQFNLFQNYEMLIKPHLQAISNRGFDLTRRLDYIHNFIPPLLFYISLVCLLVLILNLKKKFLVPIALYVISFYFILKCAPIFEHHNLYLLIPMHLIIAIAIQQIIQIKIFLNPQIQKFGYLLFIFFTIILIKQSIPQYKKLKNNQKLSQRYEQVLDCIRSENFKKEDYVISDLPIISFRLNANTYPEIAVLSSKRFETKFISFNYIGEIIKNRNPEFLVFSRFKKLQSIDFYNKYVKNHYRAICTLKKGLHFNKPTKVYIRINTNN